MKSFLHILPLAIVLSVANADVAPHIDHSEWDRLLRKWVDDRGMVDYKGWRTDPKDVRALRDYLEQFGPKPEAAATGDDRIASLINAYNAFTIQLILENPGIQSIRDLPDPWKTERYRVGGVLRSLDQIEHELLRPQIGWKVHSVVVCAAVSCPPLLNRAYTPENWEDLMEDRYRAWLAREDLNRFHPEASPPFIQISKIFEWYADDYRANPTLAEVLAAHAPRRYEEFLESQSYTIRFQPYDWSLNQQ